MLFQNGIIVSSKNKALLLMRIVYLFFFVIVPALLVAEVQPDYFVVSQEKDADWAAKREVFVRDNNQKYLIEPEIEGWYSDYLFKKVSHTIDLDGDGINEAILKTQAGGNCCGPTFFIIKKVDDGFFTVLTHPDLAGWPSIEIRNQGGSTEIWVSNFSDGAENTSMDNSLTILQLQNGNIKQVAKLKNTAFLATLVEVTSKQLSKTNNKTLEIDLDFDDVKDQLACSYWPRWGAVNCKITSSKLGKITLTGGCNRVGVLESSTDGMRDLVCNRSQIQIFNQRSMKYETLDK